MMVISSGGKQMCGIIGIISSNQFSIKEDLLKTLKRLEYRGYDSCGFATREGILEKNIGDIDSFIKNSSDNKSTIAISHTRWATNGAVTKANAHPHNYKDIFVVHNGIIENSEELKQELKKEGHVFTTQTDTEVIPVFIYEQLCKGNDMHQSIQELIKKCKGTFATLLLKKGDDALYCFKRESPLALGICENGFVLGSDVYAFSNKTNKAIFFEDDEYAIITNKGYSFYNKNGRKTEKTPIIFEWTVDDETKEKFPHYMIKEIKEQPKAARRLIQSFSTIQEDKLIKFARMIKDAKEVVFVACGTSYHAALIGCILLNSLGINARAVIASEIETFVGFGPDVLCIAVSQSGETMDVITPIKHAKEKGSRILSIVNVPYSTIQRLSDASLEILAGQEICVASTKAYTNQVIALLAIAQKLGYEINLEFIPEKLDETINVNEEITRIFAKMLAVHNDIFVLGKGISYPMAREIALKLKEIDYIHAEGMMAGELKHGTIALIENGTPVISLIPNNDSYMKGSTEEVKSRGAWTIIIGNESGDFIVPASCNAEFGIYSCVIGHLLSYYIGVEKGLEIDKPRNLAKSVTVH